MNRWDRLDIAAALREAANVLTAADEHKRQVALMKFLSRAAKKLGVAEHVYVVGGAVRNFVIDQPIKDIDMMIDSVGLKGKDSEWFAQQLQKLIPAKTNLTTNNYGVAILTISGEWDLDGLDMKGEVLEIANARKESYGGAAGKGYKPHTVEPATIEEDVKRREFTFNTLMWRLSELATGPEKAEIVDITGCGIADLKRGVMRCPSDPDKTFADDPTRMLRAIKFLVKYGFKIDGEVEKSIRRNAKMMKRAPWEAIGDLLLDVILKEPRTAPKALKEMKRLGLLDVIVEIVRETKPFRTRLAKWASDRRLKDLFEMMDLGLPVDEPLRFLDPKDRQRVREMAFGLPPGTVEPLVEALKQPGKALGDRSFIPRLAASQGVEKRDMGKFAQGIQRRVRELLIKHPMLIHAPADLREEVESALSV